MLGQIFAVISACGLFVGGHQFLKHYLCKGTHHEIDGLVTTLFSASFSLSSGLLLLVLYRAFLLRLSLTVFSVALGGCACVSVGVAAAAAAAVDFVALVAFFLLLEGFTTCASP